MHLEALDRSSLKISQFTHLFATDYGVALYNGYTGALAKLDQENVEPIKQFLAGHISLENLSDKVIEQLQYGGFIIADWFDERRVMAMRFALQNYQLSWFACTIVVTEECNFACPYCYQTGSVKQQAISKCTADKYLSYIETLKGNNISRFTMSLYGGEPLLYPDMCRYICTEQNKIINNTNNIVRNMIVTNGYLLDENIGWMTECGISKVQVTVDGTAKVHNSRRPLKHSKKGTYERIVSNCKTAADAGMKIVVRVNVEKDVTKQLNDERLVHKNITVYYEPTRYDHCGNLEKYYENQDFMYLSLQNASNAHLSAEYMRHRVGGCLASAFNSFVLLPDGSVVKCWDEVGCKKRRSISIHEPDFLVKVNHDWISWNPYMGSSKCYECKLLPNCGGGCAYRAINMPDAYCQISINTLRHLVTNRMKEYKTAEWSNSVNTACGE